LTLWAGYAKRMSVVQILFGGIAVSVAAIPLGALTGVSIPVMAIYLLAGAVYFGFLISDRQRGGGPSA